MIVKPTPLVFTHHSALKLLKFIYHIARIIIAIQTDSRGVGNGGLGGLSPPIFKLLILKKKMKLVYLNCPRHTYYSSLLHVIARSHKIS